MTLKLLPFKGIVLGHFMQIGVSSNLFQSEIFSPKAQSLIKARLHCSVKYWGWWALSSQSGLQGLDPVCCLGFVWAANHAPQLKIPNIPNTTDLLVNARFQEFLLKINKVSIWLSDRLTVFDTQKKINVMIYSLAPPGNTKRTTVAVIPRISYFVTLQC